MFIDHLFFSFTAAGVVQDGDLKTKKHRVTISTKHISERQWKHFKLFDINFAKGSNRNG